MLVLAGGENVVARIHASTSRVDARSVTEKALIEFGQAQISETPDLAGRALQHALGHTIRYQQNREEVLRIATETLADAPPTEDAASSMDDDWLGAFGRYAETKSNADIQQLWGRILAAEIRKPGSSSLRTLDFLSTITSDEANEIVDSFRFVLDGRSIPAWVNATSKIPYYKLLFLQEIGIIVGLYVIGGTKVTKNVEHTTVDGIRAPYSFIGYYDKAAVFRLESPDERVQFGALPLTKIGRELYQITETKEPDYEFFKDFVASLRNSLMEKIAIYRVSWLNQTQYTLTTKELDLPAPSQ